MSKRSVKASILFVLWSAAAGAAMSWPSGVPVLSMVAGFVVFAVLLVTLQAIVWYATKPRSG